MLLYCKTLSIFIYHSYMLTKTHYKMQHPHCIHYCNGDEYLMTSQPWVATWWNGVSVCFSDVSLVIETLLYCKYLPSQCVNWKVLQSYYWVSYISVVLISNWFQCDSIQVLSYYWALSSMASLSCWIEQNKSRRNATVAAIHRNERDNRRYFTKCSQYRHMSQVLLKRFVCYLTVKEKKGIRYCICTLIFSTLIYIWNYLSIHCTIKEQSSIPNIYVDFIIYHNYLDIILHLTWNNTFKIIISINAPHDTKYCNTLYLYMKLLQLPVTCHRTF